MRSGSFDTLTVKAQEALAGARDLAVGKRHGEVQPEHLLGALIEQEGGLVPRVLGKLGADPRVVAADLERAYARLPQVSGAGLEVGMSRGLREVWDAATKEAAKLKDEFLSTEHFLLRDSCTGCTTPPSKWSASGSLTCTPGVGAGNTCLAATLDVPTQPVQLATLDLDGDVNDDDKLYTTLHCQTSAPTTTPAPCPAGSAITGRSGNGWTCAPIADAVVTYVRTHCSIYLGWQDSCDACTLPPTRWGYASDTTCVNGAGATNTCLSTTLGGETVNLFGLNTGGDVDGNDKFHLGLACAPPTTQPGSAPNECPAGQFVAGTNVDGSLDCTDPSAAVASYIDSKCALFFGWRDSCNACTMGPSKWGRARTGDCINGAGVDNSCSVMTLGGTAVQLFGLNTDGDVNGDDTFYVALRCDP